ncbi:MAG: SGNH/GDSL hydrolase family protein [Haloechinothrix sp.]
MNYRRFVAVGDSCTEGIDDPYPDGNGYRGWADLVAQRLATHEPGLHYANLAVRGRRLDQILAEQVITACELRPDLASVFGGGNDLLQNRWDPNMIVASLDSTVRALSRIARTTLMFTLPDFSGHVPGTRRLRPKIEFLNATLEAIAERYGAVLIDLRGHPASHDRRYFGADRLHLGTRGHEMLAAQVLRLLDVPPAMHWIDPLPRPDAEPRWRRTAGDMRWLREHVIPAAIGAVRNRVIGRQPGDGFTPKHAELRPVSGTLESTGSC